MAISRPIGKNARIALFTKESVEGTFVAPSQSHHFVSEGLKYTPQSVEDPSNIGKLFTSDMIKTGYGVEGNVEAKAHPYFMGDALFFTLGKSDTPVNPAQGFLVVWYKGSANYVRIRKATTAIIAETSTNGITYTGDAGFGTAGSLTVTGMTLTQIASTIQGYADYKATFFGYASSPIANLSDWTNTYLRYNSVNMGACIQPYLVTSTVAKTHSIYADDSALADIPSMSIAIDRNFGTAKDFGLAGCKMASLGIQLEPKGLVGLSMSMKAKSQNNAYTYAATDVPASSKAYTTNLSKVFVDSLITQEVKNLTVNINNNFFTDEAIGVDTFNSQGRQGASAEISGTLNLTVTDATDEETIGIQSKMQSDVPVEILVYIEGADYVDSAGFAKFSCLIRLRSVKLSDCSPVISGPERLTLPLAGKAVANIVGRHIDVWCTNQKTTQY